MALTLKLDPVLEILLKQEARRLGVSNSAVVKDSLERTLGKKNPADLLERVRTGSLSSDSTLSESVSERMKSKLRTQHSD